MAVKVIIPAPLQKLAGNQADVEANGSNIRELIDDLEKKFPGLKGRICDEAGKIRRFINIYVNEEDVRFLQQDGTPLKSGDEVSIIPAIAGGQESQGHLVFRRAQHGSKHGEQGRTKRWKGVEG